MNENESAVASPSRMLRSPEFRAWPPPVELIGEEGQYLVMLGHVPPLIAALNALAYYGSCCGVEVVEPMVDPKYGGLAAVVESVEHRWATEHTDKDIAEWQEAADSGEDAEPPLVAGTDAHDEDLVGAVRAARGEEERA
jgi:hypothetical protein